MDINRKTAYLTLLEIEKKQAYSNLELNRQIRAQKPDSPAFVRELVYGVTDNRIYLDYLLSSLIPKGLKGVKAPVLTLLRMGLYQLIFMDAVPDYAAVSETVKLARKMTPGRDRFVNGVLRGYGRNRDMIRLPDRKTNPVEYLSVRYSSDPWIVNLWMEQYGENETESLLNACGSRPELSIRVNFLKTDRRSLAEKLQKKGFKTAEGRLSERVLYVAGSGLLDTEEYAEGLFSVQDESSVFAVETLAPKAGDTVLDICAAPGGKSLAMAEIMENRGQIRAFDIYRHKLELLEHEADRLGIFCITPSEHDGTLSDHTLKESADRVLVDGPCSGLGVIRRKPEIKYKVLEDQGRGLAEKQLQILSVSSEYVKRGGSLLYSTCTVNEIENTEVVQKFLADHRDFRSVFTRQLRPDRDETDGFFICLMVRREEGEEV